MNAQNKKTHFHAIGQCLLDHKITRFDILIAFAFIIAIALSACGTLPISTGMITVSQTAEDTEPPPTILPISGPEAARDAVVKFLQDNFNAKAPTDGLIWVGNESSPEGMVGASVFYYQTGQWSARVSFPMVSPEEIIYTVEILADQSGFRWEGLVDAYGQIATIALSTAEPTVVPEITKPVPTDSPVIQTLYFRDDRYKIAMEYPADWYLTEVSAGGADAKALRLQKGNWFLVIHYKLIWDKTILGGGLPAGEIVERGWATLLGRSVPIRLVVHDGKDKVMFYGERYDDLEFFIRLDADTSGDADYYAVDIPDNIAEEAEAIVSTMMRTGSPISPPEPTPTPVPPTPTPIPIPCNMISFDTDLTIPDGTIFGPNADFTKTWRLRNIGSCTWDTDYDLVFVDGDQMDGTRRIPLSRTVRPGERLDISVDLTSPASEGEYRGYWMLRSGSGEWFGYGEAADDPFWVDIDVLETSDDIAYNFALNLCAATWQSEEMRLPCPGYVTSEEGFAQTLKNPRLENRNENEIAIWVHPNEEKYGWIEGIYPSIEIQDGDRFQAWVGCLQDYFKCSLKFYLDYEDKNGKVRRLKDWVEEYDGEVTMIDLDLSALAGEKVRFILGVEALTRNVEDSQGFWFVPHIDSQE